MYCAQIIATCFLFFLYFILFSLRLNVHTDIICIAQFYIYIYCASIKDKAHEINNKGNKTIIFDDNRETKKYIYQVIARRKCSIEIMCSKAIFTGIVTFVVWLFFFLSPIPFYVSLNYCLKLFDRFNKKIQMKNV